MNPWIRKNRIADFVLKAAISGMFVTGMFLMAAVFA